MLGDDYVVRRPLPLTQCPADFFIQHRTEGWLAMMVSTAAFAELHGAHLFGSAQRAQFEHRLEELRGLTRAVRGLQSLIVMWACTTDEVSTLTRHYHGSLKLVSREQLTSSAAHLIDEICAVLPVDAEQHLLGTYFPEAEIPAACTTRRFFSRDNSATLQRFFLDPEQEWAS